MVRSIILWGERMKTTAARRTLAAAFAIAAAVSLTGCSMFAPSATRDEDGAISEAGQQDAFSLKVGDCLLAQEATTITEVPAVPCDQEHDEEVYFLFDMEGSDFPGDDAITAAAMEKCEAEFATYIGLDSETSIYGWYPITPTTESWEQGGDREVDCVAYADDLAKITGSLKGINQ
jgi:hypothetical protein